MFPVLLIYLFIYCWKQYSQIFVPVTFSMDIYERLCYNFISVLLFRFLNIQLRVYNGAEC